MVLKAMAVLLNDENTVKGLTCSTTKGRWDLRWHSSFFHKAGWAQRLKRQSYRFLPRWPLEGRRRSPEKTHRPSACSETQRGRESNEGNLKDFHQQFSSAGLRLTVRLLIPSENAPICRTVPSESSICQKLYKQSVRQQTNEIQNTETHSKC